MGRKQTKGPENIVAWKIEQLSSTINTELKQILKEFNGLNGNYAEQTIQNIYALITDEFTRALIKELGYQLATILRNSTVEVK